MANLQDSMTSALDAADLNCQIKTEAYAAIEEAMSLVSTATFGSMPWIGVSDEGIVSLLWERDNLGVFLCFSGDGTFAYSIKSGPDDHYATGYTELPAKDGIPESLLTSIQQLSTLR